MSLDAPDPMDRDRLLVLGAYEAGRRALADELAKQTLAAETVRGDWLADVLRSEGLRFGTLSGHYPDHDDDPRYAQWNAVRANARRALNRVLPTHRSVRSR